MVSGTRKAWAISGTVRPALKLAAAAIVRMAQIGPDGPTGGFFDATGSIPW